MTVFFMNDSLVSPVTLFIVSFILLLVSIKMTTFRGLTELLIVDGTYRSSNELHVEEKHE